MSGRLSRAATLEMVRSVLAADCACPESAFSEDSLLITEFEERPGRRRYPRPDKPLLIVTMGRGVVVSCHPSRCNHLRTILGDLPRDELFAAPVIAELTRLIAADRQVLIGPAMKYVCAPSSFRPPMGRDGLGIDVIEGEAIQELYQLPGFENALSYRPDHPRPDVAAAVAYRGRDIIGIAGASDDCDALWQIGIDVVPTARGTGIGRALVGRLTELAFARGRIPFYATAVANLRSQALSMSLGYTPAWVEIHAKDFPPAHIPATLPKAR
jgi:GNAT superfamily N-acetyltransferase